MTNSDNFILKRKIEFNVFYIQKIKNLQKDELKKTELVN